jgi:Plant transposon protein
MNLVGHGMFSLDVLVRFFDMNILNCTPIFAEVLAGKFPPSSPSIDIESFDLNWNHWLVCGIYSRWCSASATALFR